MRRWLSERGLTKEDFEYEDIPELTTIRGMKDGVFYEPDSFGDWVD